MERMPSSDFDRSRSDFLARVRDAHAASLTVEAGARAAWIEARRPEDPELWDAVASLLVPEGADGAAAPALDPGSAGSMPERLGHFRILDVLGRGGMGVVYLAEQDHPAREVALKIVRPEHAAGSILRRFAFEAEVLGRLTHPGIARIFEAGTVELYGVATPYLSMELIVGRTLDRWAEGRPAREVLALMVEVCDAVHAAHESGVIHRDLKPGNVMVTEDGRPKVLDFGLAAATDADLLITTMHTRTGELLGTVPFMAPEQVAGDPSAIDLRTDVYALGVMLHQLLVGELPYDLPQHSLLDALRAIRETEPVRLGSVRRDLRGDVETIVLKALEKDKDRRYATAGALAADLRAHLEARPISARPTSALYQMTRFARRNRVLVGGVLATFMALVAGLVVSISFWLAEAEQRAAAQQAARDVEAVSTFQGALFRYVDARAMGLDMLAELRAGVEAARVAAGLDPEAVALELARFDELVAGTNPADITQAVLADGIVALASRRADEDFAKRPYVAAEIHSGLGEVYSDLNQHEGCVAEARRGLELLPEDAPPLVRLELESLLFSGLHELGDYEACDEVYGRIAPELDEIAPATQLAWELAGRRMLNLVKRGRTEEAVALADAWRARLPDVSDWGEHHMLAVGGMGRTYIAGERVDDAEQVLMARSTRQFTSLQDRRALDAISALAVLRENQGRLKEAEALYQREIEGLTRCVGRGHSDVAVALNNLAYCQLRIGKHAESAEHLTEAIAIARQSIGPHHPDTALFVHTLGEVRLAAGELERAVERLDEAVSLYRIARNDRYVALALSQAAQALVTLGDLDGAFERVASARGERGFGGHLFEGEAFAALRADPRYATYVD